MMKFKESVAVVALLAGLSLATVSEPAIAGGDDTYTSAALPTPDAVLTRIAFGSCADEERPQPIWQTIAAADPDLFLFMGDNVYADRVDNVAISATTPAMIAEAYELLGQHPDFSAFHREVPIMATWDDHDYGLNDGGAEYTYKAESKAMLLDFFGVATDAPVRRHDGLYYARTFGKEGRRVQVIMLDTRWFRSALKPTDEPYAQGKERYIPSDAPDQVMLGEAQWAWLEEKLKEPAELRLLVSSIQVISVGHGWERWGNLPTEMARLLALFRNTGAEGIVMLSGDRHSGGLYRLEGEMAYPLYEVTASSINASFNYDTPSPEQDAPALGEMFKPENFGMITVDWEKETLALDLRDMAGATVRSVTLSLDDLKIGD
jgi:alkaline phosphatase D